MSRVSTAGDPQGDLFRAASDGPARRAREQRRAIRAPVDAHLRVTAGPGAGKTHVLVERVGHLVAAGIRPEHIALVTYTNSARDELLDRLAPVLGAAVERPFVGTIHQLCLGFVQRSLDGDAGRVRVLDPTAAERLFALVAAPAGARDPGRMLADVSLAWERFDGSGRPPDGERLETWQRFDAALRAGGMATFTSLQLWALDVLRAGLRPLPGQVLVDEYQDTTGLQVRVLTALAEAGARIGVVGDPEQSVFRFAGADPKHLPGFSERFTPCTNVDLAANGRSSAPLVELASRLRTGGEQFALRGQGPRPRLWYFDSEGQQAAHVAEDIGALLAGGVGPSRVAVLGREGQASTMASALEGARVPVWAPRSERFESKPHVRNLVFALEALADPQDARACYFLFDQVVRGAPKTWEAVVAGLDAGGDLDAAIAAASERVARPRQASLKQLAQVRATLAGLRDEELDAQVMVIADGVLEPRFSLRERQQATAIRADLERVAAEAAGRAGPAELAAWLRQGGLAPTTAEDRITLASLHYAKGREWDVVFLIDLTDGVLPHRHNLDRGEERRLLHVGISRARERLTLCAPQRLPGRGEGPSPFLAGLADACDVRDLRGQG